MATIAQVEANQANALRSTGPTSEEGKATSSRNNFRHGLCGPFLLLKWETEQDYKTLERELAAEHQPETQTERMLVRTLTESYWLRGRAIILQDLCFRRDIPDADRPRQLTLYLRYQATHERAFNKALDQLLKLKEQRKQLIIGFESHKHKALDNQRKQANEKRRQEVHERRLALLDLKLAGEQKRNSVLKSPVQTAPLPENPLQQAKQAA